MSIPDGMPNGAICGACESPPSAGKSIRDLIASEAATDAGCQSRLRMESMRMSSDEMSEYLDSHCVIISARGENVMEDWVPCNRVDNARMAVHRLEKLSRVSLPYVDVRV
jgi:hypothetical protein